MEQVSDDIKKKIYEQFGKNEKTVNDDIDIIKTWMKSQPHLPEIMEDVKIKNFLNLSKYRIEKTQERIDLYYTIKSVFPEFFEYNLSSDKMKFCYKRLNAFMLPQLLDGVHRVVFFQPKVIDHYKPMDVVNTLFAFFEIRLYEDFIIDDVVIFDLHNISLYDLKKCTPTIVSNLFNVYKKMYDLRIKKLIYLNTPHYISSFANIIKAILKPKIFERIEFHEGEDVLKKVLPKELLPKDYGGENLSLDELQEIQIKKLAEYQDTFDRLRKLKVKEHLRPENSNNNEILEFNGNFKNQHVD